MPFSMKLWQVQGKDLQEVNREALHDEQRLQDWILKDKSILGIDVLLIGRQVKTANGGRIDLLAIDGQANLVVLELKRDKAPHEIVAQTLDHASWVKDLTYEQIEIITKGFTGKPLPQAFSDHYGVSIPKTINARHSMVILADRAILRYLSFSSRMNWEYACAGIGAESMSICFKAS